MSSFLARHWESCRFGKCTLIVEVADMVVQVARGAVVQEANSRSNEGTATSSGQEELCAHWQVLDLRLQLFAHTHESCSQICLILDLP